MDGSRPYVYQQLDVDGKMEARFTEALKQIDPGFIAQK